MLWLGQVSSSVLSRASFLPCRNVQQLRFKKYGRRRQIYFADGEPAWRTPRYIEKYFTPTKMEVKPHFFPRLMCEHCYFKLLNGRQFVLCPKEAEHQSREILDMTLEWLPLCIIFSVEGCRPVMGDLGRLQIEVNGRRSLDPMLKELHDHRRNDQLYYLVQQTCKDMNKCHLRDFHLTNRSVSPPPQFDPDIMATYVRDSVIQSYRSGFATELTSDEYEWLVQQINRNLPRYTLPIVEDAHAAENSNATASTAVVLTEEEERLLSSSVSQRAEYSHHSSPIAFREHPNPVTHRMLSATQAFPEPSKAPLYATTSAKQLRKPKRAPRTQTACKHIVEAPNSAKPADPQIQVPEAPVIPVPAPPGVDACTLSSTVFGRGRISNIWERVAEAPGAAIPHESPKLVRVPFGLDEYAVPSGMGRGRTRIASRPVILPGVCLTNAPTVSSTQPAYPRIVMNDLNKPLPSVNNPKGDATPLTKRTYIPAASAVVVNPTDKVSVVPTSGAVPNTSTFRVAQSVCVPTLMINPAPVVPSSVPSSATAVARPVLMNTNTESNVVLVVENDLNRNADPRRLMQMSKLNVAANALLQQQVPVPEPITAPGLSQTGASLYRSAQNASLVNSGFNAISSLASSVLTANSPLTTAAPATTFEPPFPSYRSVRPKMRCYALASDELQYSSEAINQCITGFGGSATPTVNLISAAQLSIDSQFQSVAMVNQSVPINNSLLQIPSLPVSTDVGIPASNSVNCQGDTNSNISSCFDGLVNYGKEPTTAASPNSNKIPEKSAQSMKMKSLVGPFQPPNADGWGRPTLEKLVFMERCRLNEKHKENVIAKNLDAAGFDNCRNFSDTTVPAVASSSRGFGDVASCSSSNRLNAGSESINTIQQKPQLQRIKSSSIPVDVLVELDDEFCTVMKNQYAEQPTTSGDRFSNNRLEPCPESSAKMANAMSMSTLYAAMSPLATAMPKEYLGLLTSPMITGHKGLLSVSGPAELTDQSLASSIVTRSLTDAQLKVFFQTPTVCQTGRSGLTKPTPNGVFAAAATAAFNENIAGNFCAKIDINLATGRNLEVDSGIDLDALAQETTVEDGDDVIDEIFETGVEMAQRGVKLLPKHNPFGYDVIIGNIPLWIESSKELLEQLQLSRRTLNNMVAVSRLYYQEALAVNMCQIRCRTDEAAIRLMFRVDQVMLKSSDDFPLKAEVQHQGH